MGRVGYICTAICILTVAVATSALESQDIKGAGAGILRKISQPYLTSETLDFTDVQTSFDDKLRMALFRAPASKSPLAGLSNNKRKLTEAVKKLSDLSGSWSLKLRHELQKLRPDLASRKRAARYDECQKDYSSYVDSLAGWLLGIILDDPNPPELPDYAGSLLDAMGKIPTGLAEGKLHWVGSYEYCGTLKVNYTYDDPLEGPIERNYTGKYCRLELGPTDDKNLTLLSLGVCVPDTCNTQNVTYFLQNDFIIRVFSAVFGLEVRSAFCGQSGGVTDEPRGRAVLGYTLAIVALLVLGTLFDGVRRIVRPDTAKQSISAVIPEFPASADDKHNADYVNVPVKFGSNPGVPPGGVVHYIEVHPNDFRRYSIGSGNVYEQINVKPMPGIPRQTHHENIQERPGIFTRIILSFSALRALEHVVNTDLPEDDLGCLRGIRVVSLAWLMLGHTFLLGVVYAETWTTSNLVTALDSLFKDGTFQLVVNFHFQADSFFVVSGILASYLFLKKAEKNGGKMSPLYVCYSIVHRYYRLVVPYLLFIGFYTAFYRYLTEGPLAPSDVQDATNCKVNWWVNLLLQTDLVRNGSPCLTYTWFISTIFKFHILGLIIMVIYLLKPLIAALIMAGCVAAHMVATGILANRIIDRDSGELGDYYTNVIIAPWCRVAPFIIGMVVGIIIFKRPNQKINLFVNVATWLVALTVLIAIVYTPYDQFRDGGSEWPKARLVAYDTISRVAFACGVAWVAYACIIGHGGIVNRVLSWKAWVPLDRLGYVAFIVHGVVVFRFAYNKQTLIHVDDYSMAYLFISHLGAMYLFTVVYSVLYQWPFYFLEDAIVPPSVRHWPLTSQSNGEKSAPMFKNEHGMKKMDNAYDKTDGSFKKVDNTAM